MTLNSDTATATHTTAPAPGPASLPDVDRVYLPDPASEPLSTAQALALTSTSAMPARPEHPVAPVSAPAAAPAASVVAGEADSTTSRPGLPARTPGAADAIADSAITGPAITRHADAVAPYEHVDSTVRQEQAEALTDLFDELHPLTSTDPTYRYPKEQATGFNRGLRNAYAGGSLSDLSDADLGLATVPDVADMYADVVTSLGYDPLG